MRYTNKGTGILKVRPKAKSLNDQSYKDKCAILYPKAMGKLGKLEDILEKYNIKSIKELNNQLKVFTELKKCFYVSGTQTGNGFPNLEICVKKPNTENVYIPFYTTRTYKDFIVYQEVFRNK